MSGPERLEYLWPKAGMLSERKQRVSAEYALIPKEHGRFWNSAHMAWPTHLSGLRPNGLTRVSSSPGIVLGCQSVFHSVKEHALAAIECLIGRAWLVAGDW